MKWNLEAIMTALAEKIEEETLEAIATDKLSRSEAMDKLLVVDCLNIGGTIEDFCLKFNNSKVIDPWTIKREVECLVYSKQVEEMFESYGS